MDEYEIVFHPDYRPEFRALDLEVREAIGKVFDLIRRLGPAAGRPHVDTLKNSRYDNMKEMRVNAAGGVWRVAFAFDPRRQAVIICGGDKHGVSESRFYARLVDLADRRFTVWLAMKQEK